MLLSLSLISFSSSSSSLSSPSPSPPSFSFSPSLKPKFKNPRSRVFKFRVHDWKGVRDRKGDLVEGLAIGDGDVLGLRDGRGLKKKKMKGWGVASWEEDGRKGSNDVAEGGVRV